MPSILRSTNMELYKDTLLIVQSYFGKEMRKVSLVSMVKNCHLKFLFVFILGHNLVMLRGECLDMHSRVTHKGVQGTI